MSDISSTPPTPAPETAPAPARSAIFHFGSHVRLWLFATAGLAIDLWTKHLAFSRLSLNPNDDRGVVIANVMALRRSLNPGALFGLGKGLVPLFIGASVLALAFVLYLFAHSTRERRSLHIALGLVLAGALGNLYDRAFVNADVIKVVQTDPATGHKHTGYSSGTIVDETPSRVRIVEGLLYKPEGAELMNVRRSGIDIRKSEIVEMRRQGVVRDFIKMEPRIGSFQVWPWVFNLADSWLVIGVSLLMLNFWWDRRTEKKAEAARQLAPAV